MWRISVVENPVIEQETVASTWIKNIRIQFWIYYANFSVPWHTCEYLPIHVQIHPDKLTKQIMTVSVLSMENSPGYTLHVWWCIQNTVSLAKGHMALSTCCHTHHRSNTPKAKCVLTWQQWTYPQKFSVDSLGLFVVEAHKLDGEIRWYPPDLVLSKSSHIWCLRKAVIISKTTACIRKQTSMHTCGPTHTGDMKTIFLQASKPW